MERVNSDFEKWFMNQDFYTNMRFIHGDGLFAKDGDVYRVLPVQMTYQAWQTVKYITKDERVAITQEWHTKGWIARQEEIDQIKAEKAALEKRISEALNEIEHFHKTGATDCIDSAEDVLRGES